MAEQPIFPGTIKNAAIELDSGDTTTTTNLVTAGSKGSRIDRISITSDDTAAIVLKVFYYDTSSDFQIATINVPAGSGTDGTNPPISMLNATDMPFLGEDLALYLEGLDSIRVACTSTMTAAKVCHIVVQYGDF